MRVCFDLNQDRSSEKCNTGCCVQLSVMLTDSDIGEADFRCCRTPAPYGPVRAESTVQRSQPLERGTSPHHVRCAIAIAAILSMSGIAKADIIEAKMAYALD